MKTKPKYSDFAGFLRARRGEKYRSARDFCSRVKLAVSYPQYSRYEAGDQLPSLSQALELGTVLDVPVLEMTLEWNLAQVEKPAHEKEIRLLLSSVRSGGIRETSESSVSVALDEVIVFNRSHRDLFMKDPAYRDIFTLVNAGGPFESTTLEQISASLRIPAKKLEPMLEQLVTLGVILRSGKSYSAPKQNFYFPDDQDFFELRQSNLRHNLEQILHPLQFKDLAEKRALRGLVTRELTASQAAWVMSELESLLNKTVDLPEDPAARTIYSICAVVGERFSR